MSVKLETDLIHKRVVPKQKNQANPNIDGELNVETCIKITVFIPYPDYIINELKDWFLSHYK